MARKRMVTRTIKSTVATIKAVDVDKEEMLTLQFTLPQTYKDDEAVLKKAKQLCNNSNIKLVKVMNTEVAEHQYGISEDQFIATGEIMD